jgi:uncharacterized protein (DUF2132 family)
MVPTEEARDETGHLIRELHGVTLAQIMEYLVTQLGWRELGAQVPINCFTSNPSVKSSLNFLRRTPWAREKVERIYIDCRTEEVLAAGKAKEG